MHSVAAAIAHLANLLAGATQVRSGTRLHLQVEKRLADADEAWALYRGLLARFLVSREPLTGAIWAQLSPGLRMLEAAMAVGI